MSFNVTTLRDVVKPLQYVEEGTTAALYGTTPTSPTLTAAGINVEVTFDPSTVSETIRALGSEDVSDAVKTQEAYAFTLRSNILNTNLAKYGTEAVGGGSGSIDASLSFMFSRYLDGTEYYTQAVGCRPISTTLSVNRGLWTLDQTWHAQEIKDETSSDPLTGATYVSAIPSGSPIKHQDDATPFGWNSVDFSERSFSFTVTRDLSLLEANGNVLVLFSKPSMRTISWTAEVYKKSTAILTDYYDQTERTMTYEISTETATFGNAWITGHSTRLSGDDSSAEIESITGSARTVTIA